MAHIQATSNAIKNHLQHDCSMSIDLHRRLENLIRLGIVKTIHPSKPFSTVTVTIGAITTAKLRFISMTNHKWDPPKVGEEVVVFSPSGVLEMGIVIGGLNNEKSPSPSDDLNQKIRIFEDGCMIAYDIASHHLSAVLPEGGTANIVANVTIDGTLHVTKNITTDADVKAGEISLKTHKTSGVRSGGDTSGVPVA